ncbi:hybrid sensor histidine kinase/response regulator [Rhodanobacter sp. PCA2]|uniref:hybrid sensor histidine kinase/response regulator n=1 Tax=Rhodanobacter sp. PCA2 TaxID=2006117 RepID=UPI0015E71BDA|nr:hybrid sensor histidine kinase/response regulator [Rhodanobacter sp. PCA2]MBA2079319.1 hybrid sensor histidine kinase/response regulator [Rhodanobacter sp. PCA2]
MFASLVLGAALAVAPAIAAAGGGHAAAVPATATSVAEEPLPTPQFRRYGVADGLPSSTVYNVVQDRQGFMWFAVGVDLVRYDGVGFKTYSHHTGDSSSLPQGSVYSMLVDRSNRLWVGGFGSGLNRYLPETGGFLHWTHDPADAASLSANTVWAIAQTTDGDVWTGTSAGLDRLLPDGKHFDHVRNPLAGEGRFGAVRALLAEPDGRLWIGADEGIFVREPGGDMRRIAVDPRVKSLKIWRIQGGGRDVRIAIRGGLLRVGADGVARLFGSGQLPDTDVYGSTVDDAGHLWVATRQGLYLDDGGARIRAIGSEPLLLGGLPAPQVWQALRDREGGIWFVMGAGGIAYLAPGWSEFSRYTHVPDDTHSLRDAAASAVLARGDRTLWVGGHGVVDLLDPVTGYVQHAIDGLQGSVLDMTEDAHGRLWIVSENGVYRYADRRLAEVDLAPADITQPLRVTVAPDGRIYLVAKRAGLFRIDPDSLAIDAAPVAPEGDTGFFSSRTAVDTGAFWYSHAGTLMRWNASTTRLEDVPAAAGSDIYAIESTPDGVWLARDKAFEHYRMDGASAVKDREIAIPESWPPMVLVAIHVDRAGRFWLFCKNGLWRFDPKTGRLSSFGLRNGLVNGEVRGDSPTMTPDGTVYAASLGGVLGFRPDYPEVAPTPPGVVITSASVLHRKTLQSLPVDKGTIRLAWSDRNLRVGARASSYIDPAANCYRFRLLGLDTQWVGTGNHGEREFAGLAAGAYTLEVQAAGADGVWGAAQPLHIDVEAPPWLRWWAWLLYTLALTVVVGWIMWAWRRRLAQRHRFELIEQRRALAEQASAAKTQFLATLSHEIRTPMTGVMGMAELLLNTPLDNRQQDYTRAMQRSGKMLLKLLNDALDLVRIDAGRLELEPAPFDPRQLAEDVAQLEQGLAWSKGLRFVLEITDGLPAQAMGDAVRIKQVLLNLANNALKFTEHGSVTLRATRGGDDLLFSVSDTGPGIPEGSQARLFQRFEQEDSPQRRAGSGLGLAICHELVEMMGGSIELQSRMGHGSTFLVRLPLLEVGAAASEAPPPPSVHGRELHLLLVEDDPIVAAVITGLLQQQGHTVSHAANGLLALAELERNPCDAVLLDLDLPGVDGFQVARLIRQREGGRRLPIVAVTARSGGNDEEQARAAGMDGFLRKPLSGDELAAMLAQVLHDADAHAAAAAE